MIFKMTNRILLLKRTHEIFNRNMTMKDFHGKLIFSIPREHNLIVCDGCNSLIITELIKCLSFKKGFIHSAQCENCVNEYFSEFKTVKEHEFND